MRVSYRPTAKDDLIRHFRYYLVTQDLPLVELRFRSAVRRTINTLVAHPLMAPPYILKNPRLLGLRSWPVAGFESIRVYYIAEQDFLDVIRILHSKQDVRRILNR